jgi:uracil-DNA glycosylase family 4
VGDPRSRLVIVGEAPGFHEDQQGEPFVGPAGEMLDRMIENVLGSSRESVYIMNVLKCRPPENRDPEPGEVAACREFFDAQLNVIRPKAILALGRYAAQSLLDSTRGIKALRGQWGDYRGIPVMPTFHPAYLLRQPQDKRLTLEDLLALKRRLASEG